MNKDRKELFDWLKNWLDTDAVYNKQEIDELIENIKKFNAGAIDEYLSNHVDKVYAEWLSKKSDL